MVDRELRSISTMREMNSIKKATETMINTGQQKRISGKHELINIEGLGTNTNNTTDNTTNNATNGNNIINTDDAVAQPAYAIDSPKSNDNLNDNNNDIPLSEGNAVTNQ